MLSALKRRSTSGGGRATPRLSPGQRAFPGIAARSLANLSLEKEPAAKLASDCKALALSCSIELLAFASQGCPRAI